MKILQLTTHLEMGGISVYVDTLSRGLAARGHRVTVASSGGWFERSLAEQSIPHVRLSCRTSGELNPKLWLSVFPRLMKVIRDEKPEIIHAHTRVAQVLGRVAGILAGIPMVSTCHGLYPLHPGRRYFSCWGNRVVAISKSVENLLLNDYHLAVPNEVSLIPNGVETARFLKPVPEQQRDDYRQRHGIWGDPIIGSVARLSPVKGLDLLLKVLPSLVKKHPNLQLLLVGDGPEKEPLIRQAYALGMERHLILSCAVSQTQLPLSLMTVFAAPSRQEGFGLAIVEAMAAGVPVVASDTGGPAEIIENGKTGLLIPVGDADALEQAIDSLLSDPGKASRIAQAGRQLACQKFDINRVTGQMEELYEKTIQEQKAGKG